MKNRRWVRCRTKINHKKSSLVIGLCLLAYTGMAQDYEWRTKGRVISPKTDSQIEKKNSQAQLAPSVAPTPVALSGRVVDEDGMPMPGASVQLKGTTLGTITDANGNFSFERIGQNSFTLEIGFVGYEAQELNIEFPLKRPLEVKLIEKSIVTREVIITSSRRSEDSFTAPVSGFKAGVMELRETPFLNPYQMAANQPGVQVISSSFLVNSFNVRGLAQTMTSRVLMLSDGIDQQSPGFGLAMANINGIPELDVAAAEVVAGPASALYGPNAYNGVYNLIAKDAFNYPGLSATVKVGALHLDNIDTDKPQALVDAGIRYAKKITNRWAMKANLAYMQTEDWHANARQDVALYRPDNRFQIPGPPNPGYNGANLYGDDALELLDARSPYTVAPGGGPLIRNLIQTTRTGYADSEVADYGTRLFKADLTSQHRLSRRHELILSGRISQWEGILQTNMLQRVRSRDAVSYGTRIELKHPRYFVRAYMSGEDLPQLNNLSNTARNMIRMTKNDAAWYSQFALAFNEDNPLIRSALEAALEAAGRNIFPAGDPTAARAFADADNRALFPYMYNALRSVGIDSTNALKYATTWTSGIARQEPGSKGFDSLYTETVKNRYLNQQYGTRNAIRSRFYHLETQYSFPNIIPDGEILVGGNARMFTTYTADRYFYEQNGGVYVMEAGVYAQAVYRPFDKRMQITGSLRLDKNQNFDLQVSPRLALSYAAGEKRNHVVRVAYNSGFRPPTLEQQYGRLNLNAASRIGGTPDVLDYYNLRGNFYDPQSIINFLTKAGQGASVEEAAKQLKLIELKALQPEIARSLEVGYRMNLSEKLLLDGYVYGTYNYNLVTEVAGIGPMPGYVGVYTPQEILKRQFLFNKVYTNLEKRITTYGAAARIAYNFNTHYSLELNYGYNDYEVAEEIKSIITADFALPKHIGRVAFTGRNLAKHFGFLGAANYAAAYDASIAGIANYSVPAYLTVDAQLSYKVPSIKTIFKIGGTNILNNRHIHTPFSGTIGALVYGQISFDEFLR